MTPAVSSLPTRWRNAVRALARKRRTTPVLEIGALVMMLLIGIVTWFWFNSYVDANELVPPPLVVVMLLANLAPAIVGIILIGRRIAKRRATQSIIGASGQLHVRLVALFSMVATVPMIVLLILASLLFQYGVDIWYSTRARQMFENTTALSQQLYAEKQQRVMAEADAMAVDLARVLSQVPIDGGVFANEFAYQVYRRELSEGAILSITAQNGVQSLAMVNPYERDAQNWVSPNLAKQLLAKPQATFNDSGQRMESIVPLPQSKNLFVYASRVSDSQTLAKAKRAELVLKDYNALINRSGRLQVLLNVALYVISLAIMLVAVWVALRVADRLVSPVAELVGAARRVARGDLSAKVTPSRARDEVGILSRAFNRMTARLDDQNRELVDSNNLLERRRALTEAILSSVTAGVIALDKKGAVRVVNPPATTLLGIDRDEAVGKVLADLAPELAGLVNSGVKNGVVQVQRDDGSRTLDVKIVPDEIGHVLTFDDITEQLSDQRRAAWSDVARRIAHEIKNPLTPIQLAAERLQRRFGKEAHSDLSGFERLTGTIVRQVGDLRRMVDEFSSFARMPKPVFREEQLVDVAREAMFLHEVANPSISFKVIAPNPSPMLYCDRRQLAQALANVVKNGVEAIKQKPEPADDFITLTIRACDGAIICVDIEDNGIGLPLERDRIVEPYMTTREGGTGLGLAIVSKILEEHHAQLNFADRKGGGTIVTLRFDQEAALRATDGGPFHDRPKEDVPVALTRGRRS